MNTIKKSLITLATSLVVIASHAQEEKSINIFCDETEKIGMALSNYMKQKVIIAGKNNVMITTLWVNPEKSEWTIVGTFQDGKSCIIATGIELRLVNDKNDKQI